MSEKKEFPHEEMTTGEFCSGIPNKPHIPGYASLSNNSLLERAMIHQRVILNKPNGYGLD